MGIFQIPKLIETIAARCSRIIQISTRIEQRMTAIDDAIQSLQGIVAGLDESIGILTTTLAAELTQVADALANQPEPNLDAQVATINSVVARLGALQEQVSAASTTIAGIIPDVVAPEDDTEEVVVEEEGF